MKLALGRRMACVIGLFFLGMVTQIQAQQPTIVLGIRSIDEILGDADVIGATVGQEGLKESAEQTIDAFTGGQGLAGIDLKKPLGIYANVSDDGATPMPVAFIPVTDADALLAMLKNYLPDLRADKNGWNANINGTPVFGKVVNGYLFLSPQKDLIAKPADPTKIVSKNYDVALEVNIAGIPQSMKDIFLAQAEAQGKANLENEAPPESEAEAKGREIGFMIATAVMKSLTNDGDRLTLGIDIAAKTKMMAFDVGVTGKSGTDLAKALTAYGKLTPALAAAAGDSAPFRMVVSHPTTLFADKMEELFDAIEEGAKAEIEKDESLKSDEDRKAATDVAERLLNIARATAKSGALHSTVILEEGDDDTVRVIGGTKIANGDDAAKLLDDLLKLEKSNPDAAKVKADVAKHAGARIHAVTPDLKDDTQEMFGEEPGHFAVAKDSLWFSIGGGNLDALKKSLDLSGKSAAKTVAPISIRMKPATLVTLLESDDEGLIQRAEGIAGKSGDVLNLSIEPTTAGAKMRLEFGIDLFGLGKPE